MVAGVTAPLTGTPTRVVVGPVEGPGEVHTRLQRVKARLAAHGLRWAPTSRFGEFETLAPLFAVKALSPAGVGPRESVDLLLEGNRDFADLAMIVEYLLPPDPPADAALLHRVREVLGGALFPHRDANPATARDAQFELLVAALCRRAGIPTELREPDAVIALPSAHLGIAAKRLRSEKQVRDRVHEGGRQLERAGLVGVVALSLDALYAPDDRRLWGLSLERLAPAAATESKAVLDRHQDAIFRGAAGLPVVAVLASLALCASVPATNSIGVIRAIRVGVLNAASEHVEALQHLVARLQASPPFV